MQLDQHAYPSAGMSRGRISVALSVCIVYKSCMHSRGSAGVYRLSKAEISRRKQENMMTYKLDAEFELDMDQRIGTFPTMEAAEAKIEEIGT